MMSPPPTTAAPRRARVLAALALGVTAAVAMLVPTGAGAQIEDKRQEAAALEAEINANAEQLAMLTEQIKGVEIKLDEANATITDAQQRIEAAKVEIERLMDLVRQRAASVYRSSSRGGADASLFELDIRTLSSREKYSSAAADKDNSILDELDAAKADLADREQEAEEAKQAAEQEKAALDAKKSEFEASNAERQRLLDQVTGEIEALVAEAAEARAAAVAPQGVAGAPFDPSSIPPPPSGGGGGGGGAAVAYAQAQLGKPYCSGGSGPACFDCSGLTMMAWAQAGVSLPHNDAAQISSVPNVPFSALAPGDLVQSPGHIGINVGGGSAIHSPHTGDVVRYIGVGYFSRAGRPG
jgi:peptidoglycan DL-endopeptidase CwlO